MSIQSAINRIIGSTALLASLNTRLKQTNQRAAERQAKALKNTNRMNKPIETNTGALDTETEGKPVTGQITPGAKASEIGTQHSLAAIMDKTAQKEMLAQRLKNIIQAQSVSVDGSEGQVGDLGIGVQKQVVKNIFQQEGFKSLSDIEKYVRAKEKRGKNNGSK